MTRPDLGRDFLARDDFVARDWAPSIPGTAPRRLPSPLPGAVLYTTLTLFATMLAGLEKTRERERHDGRTHVMPPSGFRALVALDSPPLAPRP